MKIPEDLLYHPEHAWARVQGDFCTIGISDFAQKELGDIIFIELPPSGKMLKTGKVFGSVESAKSVSDLFSPVDGEVVEINSELPDAPEAINDDPYGKGWMIKVKLSAQPDRSKLLSAADYAKLIETA
jgi:glycine cleavage system H protein